MGYTSYCVAKNLAAIAENRLMRKSPNQADKQAQFQIRDCRFLSGCSLAILVGAAFFMLAGPVSAEDSPSSNLVKISKDNMEAKLAAEFQKYLQTGSPDAMCEFGMEDHGTAFKVQSSPKIIGASQNPQLAQNQNLTWQVFSRSSIVTEKSNSVKF